ncbi:hypothetical protein D1007_00475 [Hordeum vulgare]|nr:hypothetical protein D1007_00475 [Hordeum vulgare]
MPYWPNNNESSDDGEYMNEYIIMHMEYFLLWLIYMGLVLPQNPDTVIDPSFCGLAVEYERKCILHRQRRGRFVAFEGTDTRSRFVGCASTDGASCGVLEWVDVPWPVILQRKSMKEMQVERDLLKEENKLEHVISKLLKAGHGCKENLDKIKEVVMKE